MKKIWISLSLGFMVVSGLFAQNVEEKLIFELGPEIVKVYNSESTPSATGFTLIDEFDDNFSLKLTNTLYKVNLFFDTKKKDELSQSITNILKTKTHSGNAKKETWKKTDATKKPIYLVELAKNKLKIRIYRKQMDSESYALINRLGKSSLQIINK